MTSTTNHRLGSGSGTGKHHQYGSSTRLASGARPSSIRKSHFPDPDRVLERTHWNPFFVNCVQESAPSTPRCSGSCYAA